LCLIRARPLKNEGSEGYLTFFSLKEKLVYFFSVLYNKTSIEKKSMKALKIDL
jgi:hypothetical protein